MELSFDNLALRLDILRKVYSRLQKREKERVIASLCNSMNEVLDNEFYYQLSKEWKESIDFGLFPEIQKHKPKKQDSFLFWFDKYDYNSRYIILRAAITELETQINNSAK